MKIIVKCSPSSSNRTFFYNLEDLNCDSIDEWNNFGKDEKITRLQKLVDGEFEQPYWFVDDFNLE